ncbi:hypothetical protein N9948_00170 [bacterium]|nr:hypothetical protein [bacterium]
MSFYTGVGSRNAPPEILSLMAKYASILEGWDYVLRTGDAKGSDKSFSKGVKNSKNKIVLKSNDAKPWAYDYVCECMPIDRPKYDAPGGYLSWKPYVKGLLARNMMQVLGINGEEPSQFLICWTPDEDMETSLVGGTGYAIRCAKKNKIPVFNLVFESHQVAFEGLLRNILTSRVQRKESM